MAKDEMEAMTEDKWGEEIWGVEHQDPSQKPADIPKLIFYFGENVSFLLLLNPFLLMISDSAMQDHWVANSTRDALMAAREKPDGEPENASSKPIMLIDEYGVDHGFCISEYCS